MADPLRKTLAERPALTLPAAEAEALRSAYDAAQVILEYGSGGSTALAAGLAGRLVFSVESDPVWLDRTAAWLAANPPAADVRLHRGDIGATKEWGYPASNGAFRKWPGYALSVWERPDFQQPDTVLVDGRFRIACFLTVLVRTTGPVTVLWDDYGDRPPYHRVEDFVRPVATHGRLARFQLEPMPLPPGALRLLAESFMDPR